MEFEIGDRVELLNRLEKICGYGQIKNIIKDEAQITPSEIRSLEAYCLPGSDLLWPLSNLRLVEKVPI
jgi:hypothetical protein